MPHTLQETFEDAVETGSVRSLTKRQQPAKRLSAEDRVSSDYEEGASKPAADGDKQEPRGQTADKKPPRPPSQASAGSLDNVNLDDDSAAATARATAPQGESTERGRNKKTH